jgi:2-amino-4-hydroxy-6-hydroxymethyldihydropteridine diphosphokinase
MSSGIYLLLGTNIGARFMNLQEARNLINTIAGKIVQESAIYETAPWGIDDQPLFLNQVVQIETNLDPDQLLIELLQIENRMGRVRQRKWEPRIVDIDILFYHQEIINTKTLHIPHPRLHERRFTLVPLKELNPAFVHPVSQKSIHELLEQCPDTLAVSKYTLE